MHWIEEGSKGSKYFFSPLNYKHKKERIEAIRDENGYHIDNAEIISYSIFFYKFFFKENN
jgi:hypothetical protein